MGGRAVEAPNLHSRFLPGRGISFVFVRTFFSGGWFCGMLLGVGLVVSCQGWSGTGSFVGLEWAWTGGG